MKIDVHVHATLEKSDVQLSGPVVDCTTLVGHLRAQGIGRAVLMASAEEDDRPMSNAEMREIVRRHPDFYAWMGVVDPARPEGLAERVRALRLAGAVGVGEFFLPRTVRMDDPGMEALYAACEAEGLPILFHASVNEGDTYGFVDRPGFPVLEDVLRRYPRLVLIGHSWPFWEEVGGRVPELMRRYPNLWADVSAKSGSHGVMHDPELGRRFLEEFSDRVLFGTDTIRETQVFPLGAWLDGEVEAGRLSKAAYGRVCEGNARRLFTGIDIPVGPQV